MADGEPIIQGWPGWITNLTQTPTAIRNQNPAPLDGTGLYVFSSPSGLGGLGLYANGQGTGNPGVVSTSSGGDGVAAAVAPGAYQGSAGIRGTSSDAFGFGVWGQGYYGVYGNSAADNGIAVEGDASGRNAVGVHGSATGGQGSIGVYAYAAGVDSAALQVNGRAVFSSCAQIVVPAGATSVVQSGLYLSTAAFVLATLQQNLPQVSVRAAVPDPAAGTVTIYLTAPAPVDATVAWMVVN
jgi:hypothetical protein